MTKRQDRPDEGNKATWEACGTQKKTAINKPGEETWINKQPANDTAIGIAADKMFIDTTTKKVTEEAVEEGAIEKIAANKAKKKRWKKQ